MSKIKRWTVSLPSPDGYDIQPFDTTFHTPQEIVLAADHDAEIERLRGIIQLLNKSRPDAELARLRGLLRDAGDGLDDYWVTTKEGVDWMQRVREALGE